MTVVKVRFDGRVFVPESPLDLPVGYAVEIPVPLPSATSPESASKPPLVELMEILAHFPPNPDWPADGAAQHDHYLYGTPKHHDCRPRNYEVVAATRALFDAGLRLHAERADQEWSLTDCISFAVMQDRSIQRALAHDHHFEQAGFEAMLRRDPP